MRLAGKRLFVCGMIAGVFCISTRSGRGDPVTPGDVIASVSPLYRGNIVGTKYIAEYSSIGRVQILTNVPQPGGTGATTDYARDLIMGTDNALYLYNGTFNPYLARLDLGTLGWTQQTFAGWSTLNILGHGGIARLGAYYYVTDMETFNPGGSPSGIIRFDTSGGPTVRFALGLQPNDLYIGSDGVLYALAGNTITKYNPLTFASLGSLSITGNYVKAIAVVADGSIFVANLDGHVNHFSNTGILLNSLTIPGAQLSDIDIDSTGRIVLGTINSGIIAMTDTSFVTYTTIPVGDNATGGEVYVAWVTIPEPSSMALLATAVAALVCLKRPYRNPKE